MAQTAFWPWEIATHVPASAQPGWVAQQLLTALTVGLFGVCVVLLYPAYGVPAFVVSLFFARQMALDLTTYTLADIYTLPAMAVALAAAYSHDMLAQSLLGGLAMAALGAAVAVIQWWSGGKGVGMGGGDTKLLLAMGVWLGPVDAMVALAVGCVAWWPLAWLKPKAAQPFGVVIGVGWLILLCVPHLPKYLTLPI